MMKQYEKNIEAEVAKTMKLLDELEPLEVHHLFRVKVMQRVERTCSQKSRRIKNLSGRMADFRFAFMALLVIVNVGSTMLSLKNSKTLSKNEISELYDASGDDYSTQEFAYYDQTGADAAATSNNESLTP